MLHDTPSMILPTKRLYGVDGCRHGWVVAASDGALEGLSFGVVRRIAPLLG
jgi:hypothetical protein